MSGSPVKARLESQPPPQSPTSEEIAEKLAIAEKRRKALLEEKKAPGVRSEERRQRATEAIERDTFNKGLVLEDKLVQAEARRESQLQEKAQVAGATYSKAKQVKEGLEEVKETTAQLKRATIEEELKAAEERRLAQLEGIREKEGAKVEHALSTAAEIKKEQEEAAQRKEMETAARLKAAEERRLAQLEEFREKEGAKVRKAVENSKLQPERDQLITSRKLEAHLRKLEEAEARRLAASSPK